jgi:hypothetical protein
MTPRPTSHAPDASATTPSAAIDAVRPISVLLK